MDTAAYNRLELVGSLTREVISPGLSPLLTGLKFAPPFVLTHRFSVALLPTPFVPTTIEFPEALTSGNRDRLYRMLTYFLANPKSAPMPLLIGSFYTHFNRLYQANFVRGKSDKDAAAALGISPYRVKDIMAASQHWPLPRVERCLLLLAKYSTMAVGIKNTAGDKELLKEMVGQMLE